MSKKYQRKTYRRELLEFDQYEEYNWNDFLTEANALVKAASEEGFSEFVIYSKGYYDDYRVCLYAIRKESDEEFRARVEKEKAKDEVLRKRKIEKLEKQAKELGLKITKE